MSGLMQPKATICFSFLALLMYGLVSALWPGAGKLVRLKTNMNAIKTACDVPAQANRTKHITNHRKAFGASIVVAVLGAALFLLA